MDGAREALGGVDVLVHNASALAVGPDLSDWEASLEVDLMAGVHAAEHVIPWMAEASGGSILFVSSNSGIEADPMPDYGYTAAKAALIAHAKRLAVMHAPRGIRANTIAPGSIEFPGGIWAMVKEQQPQNVRNGPRIDPIGAPWHPGRGGRCGRLPGVPKGHMGHGRMRLGRRRPAARYAVNGR